MHKQTLQHQELQRADVSTREHGRNRMRPGLQRPPGLCTCPRLQRLPQHCQPAFAPDLVSTCWSELQLQPGLLALPAWSSNASVIDHFFYGCAVLFAFSNQINFQASVHSAGVACCNAVPAWLVQMQCCLKCQLIVQYTGSGQLWHHVYTRKLPAIAHT